MIQILALLPHQFELMSRQKLTDLNHVDGLQLFVTSNKNGEEIVLKCPQKTTILRPPPFNKKVTTGRYVANTSNIPRVRVDTKVPKKYGSNRYKETQMAHRAVTRGKAVEKKDRTQQYDEDASELFSEETASTVETDGRMIFSPTGRFAGIHPVRPVRLSEPEVTLPEPLKEDTVTDKSLSPDGSVQSDENHASPLSSSADTPLIFPRPISPSLHLPQYERSVTAPPSLISLGIPSESGTRRGAQIINCTETTQTTHNKDGVTWSKRLTTTWKTLDSPQKNIRAVPPRKSQSTPSVPTSSFSYQPVSTTSRGDWKKIQRDTPQREKHEETWEPRRVQQRGGTPTKLPMRGVRPVSSPSLSMYSPSSGRGKVERDVPLRKGVGRGRSPALPVGDPLYTKHPLRQYMDSPHSAIVETKSYRGEDEVWTNNHVLYFRGPNETTDLELKTAIQSAISDAKSILGRDMGTCITNLVAKHTGETFGYGYIWVSSSQMYNVLLGLNPDGSQRYRGNPNNEPVEDIPHGDDEQKDDGWGDYFPLKKNEPLKRIESWADEVEESERSAQGKGSSKENIEPIIVVTIGDEHESCKIEQAKAMDVSVEFVHNVICCTKVPTGITESDIQSAFLPFVSDRSKRVGGRSIGTYPHVAITARNVAYVTFDPETRNAQFALFAMGRVVIKGCSINFKQCKERRRSTPVKA